MALILQIDTATEAATVSIARDGKLIDFKENINQKDHAAFLQPAVKDLLSRQQIGINELNAVSVVAGPGSYTGLRVGLASAKGLCYTLDLPLIMLNTLEVMALSAIIHLMKSGDIHDDSDILFCPMIDARRSEVFTAVYDPVLNVIHPPEAMVLSENSFINFLDKSIVVFSGNGATKIEKMLQHQNMRILPSSIDISATSILSDAAFSVNNFADVAYSEPYYIKSFYSPSSKT